MASAQPTWVLGHLNPDTDSIASALGYAWVLQQISASGTTIQAGRAGNLNDQTAFAMQQFGAPELPLVEQVDGQNVVLVDHNEYTQAVAGMENANVVEVLDHHRLGMPGTLVPITIHIEPVGSCSTLVYERAQALGQTLPRSYAGMLLSGILSDTLVFRSPTTTARERAGALGLARLAGLADANADENTVMAAITEYGARLLGAGAGLGTKSADDILNTDLKFFEEGDLRVGIGQVEVTHFGELPTRAADLYAELAALVQREKLVAAVLMVTDVSGGNSRILVTGDPRVQAGLPYVQLADGTLDAPGVVSRKKQLLPDVLATLTAIAEAG